MWKCEICGKELNLSPSVAKTRKTCSKECKSILMSRKKVEYIEQKCLVCGKVMVLQPSISKTKKTCSKECDAKRRRKEISRICCFCGKSFQRRAGKVKQRFCSLECKFEAQSRGLVKSHSYGNYGYSEISFLWELWI